MPDREQPTDPLSEWWREAWAEVDPYSAAERVATILDRMATLEALGKRMRRELIEQIEATDLTLEEVADIYWRFDKVPMAALGEQKEVWAAAAARPYWSWRCRGCGAEVFIKSRTEKLRYTKTAEDGQLYLSGMIAMCDDCRAARSAEQNTAWQAQQNLWLKRLQDLRTMPYKQYLQTPEWQERRKAALKRAGYKCQVCNRSRQLHTHHRTYERRGAELARDLIVLCDECHALYHGKGLLPAHED